MNDLRNIPLQRVLVLDTETTGLGENAELLQCTMINGEGKVLLNQYIRPLHTQSWPSAEAVNGINFAMVQNMPTIQDVRTKMEDILQSAAVIIGYNLPFDLKMLYRQQVRLPDSARFLDLMVPFAKVCGDFCYGHLRNKKLSQCAAFYGWKEEKWHDSLQDCKATLYCFQKMLEAGVEMPYIPLADIFLV